MSRRRPAALASFLALLALALLALAPARGEIRQEGELIVSFDGGLEPLLLPRLHPGPAAIELSGELRTADRSPLPRVERVELALAGRGYLDFTGLATCRRRELLATSTDTALGNCADALVGHGQIDALFYFPEQPSYSFHGAIRAFNGRFADGRRLVWVQVYGSSPPSAFVFPFVLHRRPGPFATSLLARLPANLGPWPRLANFEITLSRRFAYRGTRRSYLNARCPLPPRFTAGIFPLARVSYDFADGRSLATSIVRGCRAPPLGATPSKRNPDAHPRP